jgi:hypothetical protein
MAGVLPQARARCAPARHSLESGTYVSSYGYDTSEDGDAQGGFERLVSWLDSI